MRTKTITLYAYAELSSEAQASARKEFTRAVERYDEIPWSGEIMDSLKGTFKAAGIDLRDWSIGTCNPCYVKFAKFDAEGARGARAMAWLENNLFAQFRIPWTGKRRRELAKYGSGYRPGLIDPCPVTGVCFDEDLFDSLRESVRTGDTLREAFEGLAGVAGRLMESEYEAQFSDEAFEQWREDQEFDEFGHVD